MKLTLDSVKMVSLTDAAGQWWAGVTLDATDQETGLHPSLSVHVPVSYESNRSIGDLEVDALDLTAQIVELAATYFAEHSCHPENRS